MEQFCHYKKRGSGWHRVCDSVSAVRGFGNGKDRSLAAIRNSAPPAGVVDGINGREKK